MAGILDRYGIKEVADVTFYELVNGEPAYPVLYLDTLKVSTIEQTAENVDAKGGKGNAALISWDYGKEINVTLEDALFSAKSMAIMFGNGKVNAAHSTDSIMRTEVFQATGSTTITGSAPTEVGAEMTKIGWKNQYVDPNGDTISKSNPKFYTATGEPIAATGATGAITAIISGEKYFCSYDLTMKDAGVIEISASSFPGTYYVTGDTYARSEADGKDEFFQFIIPKAKVTAENTITLEAEGDPSVFNLNIKVLRPADGVMMKLVKYDLNTTPGSGEVSDTWYHNHILNNNNMPS